MGKLWLFVSEFDEMRSNGSDHPLKDVEEKGLRRRKKLYKDSEQTDPIDQSIEVEYRSSEEESNSSFFDKVEYQKSTTLQSSVKEISQSSKRDVTPSPPRQS